MRNKQLYTPRLPALQLLEPKAGLEEFSSVIVQKKPFLHIFYWENPSYLLIDRIVELSGAVLLFIDSSLSSYWVDDTRTVVSAEYCE